MNAEGGGHFSLCRPVSPVAHVSISESSERIRRNLV